MHKAALLACTLAAAISASYAFAQSAQTGPQNQAIKSEDSNNSSMPVKGANSFTQSEAKSHISDKGYTNIGTLHKDSNGVWRGTASKYGKRVHVTVDYQGNVNAE